jgi:hypothetical protein
MIAAVTAVLILLQGGPEERVDDTEYDRSVAVHVKAVEAVEKGWRKEPAAALQRLEPLIKVMEAELVPKLPRLVESTIAVRATRGIDKGEIKERHAFFPYKLAGEIALAAGEPEKAVEFLSKSPSSATLLADAKAAMAVKKTSPPRTPTKTAFELQPYLDKKDYMGALEAIRAQRAALGADADKMIADVRREAASQQKSSIALLAGLLPRLDQEGFRKEHVEPCLQSNAKVPADTVTEELRWVRDFDRWLEKRDPAEFERLALAAASFGGDFCVLCDRAQDARLAEIEKLVGAVSRAERKDRAPLLDQVGQAERAFAELSKSHAAPGARERLEALKAKLPIDEKVLDEARAGLTSIADIRRLADELDRLWVSDRRARLSVPDQKDLGLYLGLYRCMALFLDGKTIDEATRDLRLREVFKGAPELPKDVSPKVVTVRARLNR